MKKLMKKEKGKMKSEKVRMSLLFTFSLLLFTSAAQAAKEVAERDILLNEAARQGVVLSDDELWTHLADNEELMFALGEDGANIREDLREDLLVAKMRHQIRCEIAELIPRISSESIAQEQAAVARHNVALAETNRSLCRLATNAWNSIRGENDFTAVGNKLIEMNTNASYEAVCEDAAIICTNLAVGEMSAPLLEDGALSFYKVSSTTAGVRQISRIAFRLQKPQDVLSNEQIEMLLVRRAIDAMYEKWLKTKRRTRQNQSRCVSNTTA